MYLTSLGGPFWAKQMFKNAESIGCRKINEISTDATSLIHWVKMVGSDGPSWANQMVENSETGNL